MFPRNGIVSCDVGSHKLLMGQFWRSYEPGTFFMSNGLSGMGFGIPAAIAAQLVYPDRAVMAIVGDGGMLMMTHDLVLIRELGLPLIVIVLVDNSLSLIRISQERRGYPPCGVDFVGPKFDASCKCIWNPRGKSQDGCKCSGCRGARAGAAKVAPLGSSGRLPGILQPGLRAKDCNRWQGELRMSEEQSQMTDAFAQFVEDFTFEQVPATVLTRTKEVLYDGIGALLSATSPRYDIGGVLGRFVRETGGAPDSQVFGTPLRTNCVTAALVNGTFGYYCDIESHHAGAIMHAIAVVGPAAIAVGERQRVLGRDVLAAIVVGIDTACRLSYALSAPALYARGFHPTCVAGTFGSLAARTLVWLKRQSASECFRPCGD